MAASAPERDYVHRLHAKLEVRGVRSYFRIRHASHWERNFDRDDCLSYYVEDRDFRPDIVIFRLGENVTLEMTPRFSEAMRAFLDFLRPAGGRVILTTAFWPNEVCDTAVRALAWEWNCPCAEIACTDDSLMALGLFSHRGVSKHPGDAGMEMIADRLLAAILQE
jgi:hypothetical protein